jgi:exonuclease 3'-5' domain-containing protein 1
MLCNDYYPMTQRHEFLSTLQSTAYDDKLDNVWASEYISCELQPYQKTLTAIETLAASRPSIKSLLNMSTTSAQSNATFIALEADLLPLLDSISNLPVDPPSLYLDMEGIDLGRHGSISVLSLHIGPTQMTYLIDIHSLRKAAFLTTNNSGTSMQTTLESLTIPKVVFHIRNDLDALFSLFQISVDCIKDL